MFYNKKTLIKTILGLNFIVLLLSSCAKSDLIDLEPEFSLDAISNPSTIEQLTGVLTGAYSTFRNANYYGSASGTGNGYGMMVDVISDNVYEATTSLSNSKFMTDWNYNQSTGQVSTMYQAPYTTIAYANIVIRDADKFADASSQKRINRLKGQAYALRAMAHFDVFRYFAVSYDRNSTNNWAVPYVKTFAVSPTIKPSRPNNKSFYDDLFADLATAQQLLQDIDQPINTASATTRPFIDLTGLYALQARIYLYAQMWPEAITAATNAINARPLVNLNQTTFTGMYRQQSSGEIIWNVQFEAGQSGPSFLLYFPASQSSYFRPSYAVAVPDGNSGLLQNNDIRYNAFFGKDAEGRINITKYQGKNALTDGNANFLVFRTGEMYLIRAEARARTSPAQESAAMDDLNTLRAARITGYVNQSLTGNALLTAIADERRRELFCEGHRFFDLKRTTHVINRTAPCGDLLVTKTTVCGLPSDAREWAFPIPDVVTNFNENIRAQQNPGYN